MLLGENGISRVIRTGTVFPITFDCTAKDELQEAPELHGVREFGHAYHVRQGEA